MLFGSRLHITLTHCLAISAGTAVLKGSVLVCKGSSVQGGSNRYVRSLYLRSFCQTEGADMRNKVIHLCMMCIIQGNFKWWDDDTCKTNFKAKPFYSLCAGAAGRRSGMASLSLLHTGVGTLHQQAVSQRPVWVSKASCGIKLVSSPAGSLLLFLMLLYAWHAQAAIICEDENSTHLFFFQATTRTKPCHRLACCPGFKVWFVTWTIRVWIIQRPGRHQARSTTSTAPCRHWDFLFPLLWEVKTMSSDFWPFFFIRECWVCVN